MFDEDDSFSWKPFLKHLFSSFQKRAIFIIIVVGFLVFANALFNRFIYDDIPQIVENPLMKSIINIPMLLGGSNPYQGFTGFDILHMHYRPLFLVIYNILFNVFGTSVFPFHLLQLVIHILNAVLIFFVISNFITAPSIALFLSLIFLVHPINSEAVIYIADLQDTLFVFFGLSALYMLIKKQHTQISYKHSLYLGSLLFLSLLSKETGILFGVMAFFFCLFFSRRNLKRLLCTLLLTSSLYILLRSFASLHPLQAIMASLIQRSEFLVRIASIPKVILYYVSKFVFPVHLAIGQEWLVQHITLSNFYLPLLFDFIFFSGIFMAGLYIYRKQKKSFKSFVFFALWFVIGLVMHLPLFPLDNTVADRWFYFPIIGLLGMFGILIGSFKWKQGGRVLGVGLLFLLSLFTIIRNRQWKTPLSLYGHDVLYAESSPRLDNLYGLVLMDNGRLDEARLYFERSMQLDPLFGNNTDNLALWHEKKGDYNQARSFYTQSLEADNGRPKFNAYSGLARIALKEKDYKKAEDLASSGLIAYPWNEDFYQELAIAQYFLGKKEDAMNTVTKWFKLTSNPQSRILYQLIMNNQLTVKWD